MTTEERIQKSYDAYFNRKLSGLWLNDDDWDVVKSSYIAGATSEAARNKENAIELEKEVEEIGNESLVFEMDLLRAKEEIERLKKEIKNWENLWAGLKTL